MSETKIEVKWVPIEDIKPHPKNPNKHSKEQIERLAKIIKGNGFRSPVIISARTGYLIAGHGRLTAARSLNLEKIPAIFQEFHSDESEYQHLVADNAIASWAELDLSQIHTDIQELGPFDLDLLGIEDFRLEPDPEPAKKEKAPILCSNCRQPVNNTEN